MDFMKWLNSLDELLYEVISWLVFYPSAAGEQPFWQGPGSCWAF